MTHSTPNTNQYELIAELGRGGMGTTWAALHKETGERVALKKLNWLRVEDWKSVELFEREARILQNLQHPGIPSFLDHFQEEDGKGWVLVQELAPGHNLETWLSQGWHPNEQDVRNVAEQMLEVLSYLQNLQPPVFHRDIKPQNIIRDEAGRIYLVDFGAVQDVYQHTLSGGSTIVGTFGYMPPEQLRGLTTHASDLYGLGSTLLFLLTRSSPADLPHKRLRIDVRNSVQVSDSFALWLEKMVEPIAEDRFSDAQVALDTLRAPSQSQTITASQAPDPEVPVSSGPSATGSAIIKRITELDVLSEKQNWWSTNITIVLDLSVGRELNNEEVNNLIGVFQDHSGGVGQVNKAGHRYVWRQSRDTNENDVIKISISPRKGTTTIQIHDSLRVSVLAYFIGAFFGLIVGLIAGNAMGLTGTVTLATVIITGIIFNFSYDWLWSRRRTSRRLKATQRLEKKIRDYFEHFYGSKFTLPDSKAEDAWNEGGVNATEVVEVTTQTD